MQQHGTATLTFQPYSTTAAGGVNKHTATMPFLINTEAGNTGPLDAVGDVWEKTFYQTPTHVFGAATLGATFTISVFQIEADPYQ